jgi:hypothetical protein
MFVEQYSIHVLKMTQLGMVTTYSETGQEGHEYEASVGDIVTTSSTALLLPLACSAYYQTLTIPAVSSVLAFHMYAE